MSAADLKVVVTTGHGSDPAHEAEARALAARCGLPYEPRRDRNTGRLFAESGAGVLAVVAGDGLSLWRGEVRLRFTSGLAELRIKRVLAGEHEPLTALAGLGPGDLVLDCTLGLARDALVMAASGARVEGLEAVPLLAAFAEAGLARLPGAAGQVASRVAVRLARAEAFLAAAPERAYDVVYLDPMFTEEVRQPPDYELFRLLTDPWELSRAAVERARRVARRAVVLKDGPRARAIKGLGLPLRELTSGNRVRYGLLDSA